MFAVFHTNKVGNPAAFIIQQVLVSEHSNFNIGITISLPLAVELPSNTASVWGFAAKKSDLDGQVLSPQAILAYRHSFIYFTRHLPDRLRILLPG
jgi:hypothetical protein